MKKIFSTLLFLILSGLLMAQTGLLGYGSNAVMPLQMANPALAGEGARLVVALPLISSVSIEQKNSFKMTDMLRSEGTNTYLSFPKFLTTAIDRNYMNFNTSLDVFNIGFRVKDKNFFSIGSQVFGTADASFSKSFVKLLAEGNATNTTITLNNESMYINAFSALFLGYSRSLMNDRLKIGVKVKMLNGLAEMQANKDNFNATITTDPNSNPAYALSVTSKIQIPVAGLMAIAIDSALNATAGNSLGSNATKMGSGTGFDLGASFQVTSKLTVSASVINIGSINWKKEYSGKFMNGKSGSINYGGEKVDINNPDANKDASDNFEKVFKDAFDPKFVEGAYTSSLPKNMYVAVNYKISEKHQVSAVHRIQSYNGTSNSVTGLNYAFTPKQIIQLLGGVNFLDFKDPSFGAGIVFSPGPIQLHILADNVSGLSAIDDTKRMQIQVGLNVVLKNRKTASSAETPK